MPLLYCGLMGAHTSLLIELARGREQPQPYTTRYRSQTSSMDWARPEGFYDELRGLRDRVVHSYEKAASERLTEHMDDQLESIATAIFRSLR